MEIEKTKQENEFIDKYSPFGFRIPGFNDEQKIIEILKSKFSDQNINPNNLKISLIFIAAIIIIKEIIV